VIFCVFFAGIEFHPDPSGTLKKDIFPMKMKHPILLSVNEINEMYIGYIHTLKLTANAPENGWLEYYFPIGKGHFQVLC